MSEDSSDFQVIYNRQKTVFEHYMIFYTTANRLGQNPNFLLIVYTNTNYRQQPKLQYDDNIHFRYKFIFNS